MAFQMTQSTTCDHCGGEETSILKFRRCARCKGVKYCSKGCQVAAWPSHRLVCRDWVEANAVHYMVRAINENDMDILKMALKRFPQSKYVNGISFLMDEYGGLKKLCNHPDQRLLYGRDGEWHPTSRTSSCTRALRNDQIIAQIGIGCQLG